MATNIHIHLTPKKTVDRTNRGSDSVSSIPEILKISKQLELGYNETSLMKKTEAQLASMLKELKQRLKSYNEDAGFTTYDPREAARLDGEIKAVEAEIQRMKKLPTPPPMQIQNQELVLSKLKKERAKYRDASNAAR